MNRVLLSVMVMVGVVCTANAQAPDLDRMDIVLKSVPDGPVALVDGAPVDGGVFRTAYILDLTALRAQAAGKELGEGDRAKLGVYTLRSLIQDEILAQEARKRKLAVAEEEVQKTWQSEMDMWRKAFARTQDNAEITEEELLKRAGKTREQALDEVRKGLLAEKARASIAEGAGVKVTDQEINEVFAKEKDHLAQPEMCHVVQVFLRVAPRPTENPADVKAKAKAKAEDALKRIQTGQSFESVARAVNDPPFRDNGGDFGPVPMTGPNALPPFLAEQAYKMKPGDISGIIESEFGFHIVKLVEMKPGAEPSLEKVKPLIERQLMQVKTEEAIGKFCEPILADPNRVKVFLELEKVMAAHGVIPNKTK